MNIINDSLKHFTRMQVKYFSLSSTNLSSFYRFFDLNIILIALLTSLAYFYGYLNATNQSLTAHDEALYVGRARLMLDNHDWFTPFDSAHHKTVGSYWLIALSLKIDARNFDV